MLKNRNAWKAASVSLREHCYHAKLRLKFHNYGNMWLIQHHVFVHGDYVSIFRLR